MLTLAHYSLRLSSHFVFEQCFEYLMYDHFRVRKQKQPISLKHLFDTGMKLADVFRSEHILIDKISFDTFQERYRFLANLKVIDINEQEQTIQPLKGKTPVLDLFSQMCQAFVDTYLVVLMTLEIMCAKHMIVKQKLIV